MNKEHPLYILHKDYNDQLNQIRNNRSTIKDLEEKNRELQENLKVARENLISYIKQSTNSEVSIYRLAKEAFGKIDDRHHQLCNLMASSS